MNIGLNFLDYQCRVCAAEAEAVAEHGVDFRLDGTGSDVELFAVLVGVLEVDVRGDKVVLHHQRAVDDFRSARHPAFVARHALCRRDESVLA